MEEIKFKVNVKDCIGGVTTAQMTISEQNVVSAIVTKTPGRFTIDNIDSENAAQGTVITANGSGGASWLLPGEDVQDIVELTTTSGTLTEEQLHKAQLNDCFIKLTINNNQMFFRKYLETNTMIYFTFVSEGDVSGDSAQINRNHIDITISSGS